MTRIPFETQPDDRVTIVAVDERSYRAAQGRRFYAYPIGKQRYDFGDFLAFYRLKPKSSVTSIARILGIETGGEVDDSYRLMAFGDRVFDEAEVISLSDIRELDPELKAGGQAIQGPVHTTVEVLEDSTSIRDLFNRKRS